MGESIYIRKQEESAVNAPGQSVLFPTLNGMTLHGGIGQNNGAPDASRQHQPLDMAIFGVGKGPGNQLFDHAQGTMRQMLDRANALNVAPEGTPQGDAIKKIVAGQTAQGIMDKGGDGPRLEKTDGQLPAPREEKPTWEVDPQNSDITNTPGMPEYRDTMKFAATPEDAAEHASNKGTGLNMTGQALTLGGVVFPPLIVPGIGLQILGYNMDKYGKDYYAGTYVVDKEDPQRERDIEETPKWD